MLINEEKEKQTNNFLSFSINKLTSWSDVYCTPKRIPYISTNEKALFGVFVLGQILLYA